MFSCMVFLSFVSRYFVLFVVIFFPSHTSDLEGYLLSFYYCHLTYFIGLRKYVYSDFFVSIKACIVAECADNFYKSSVDFTICCVCGISRVLSCGLVCCQILKFTLDRFLWDIAYVPWKWPTVYSTTDWFSVSSHTGRYRHWRSVILQHGPPLKGSGVPSTVRLSRPACALLASALSTMWGTVSTRAPYSGFRSAGPPCPC